MDNLVERRRHSAAHVLATAAQRLFPNVKLGAGPVTNSGFYQDFEFAQPISWEDVRNLESEMNMILQQNLSFNRLATNREQAFSILMTRGQLFKSELLQEIPDEEVSFYQTGEEFIDLCRGPHVESTGKIGVIKLLELTDTNWKNDSERPAMQRVSGVAFATLAELNQYLHRLDAIKTRDFRRYLEEMELAVDVNDDFIYTPHGTTVIKLMRDQIVSKLHKESFVGVLTSAKTELKAQLNDLNSIYNHKNRSYRHLPLRLISEQRVELSRPYKINGKNLDRVYELAAKSFCTTNNLLAESRMHLQMAIDLSEEFSLKLEAQLTTGDPEQQVFKYWAEMLTQRGIAQTQIISADTALTNCGLKLYIEDSLKRRWLFCELEFATKLNKYVSDTGEDAYINEFNIVFILEELLGYLIEEGQGGLPFMLTPIQTVIVPISEEQTQYAQHIEALLRAAGIRTEVDNSSETMQAKIREAELSHVPAILVIGEKEVNSEAVSVRLHDDQELGLIGEDILLKTLSEVFNRGASL